MGLAQGSIGSVLVALVVRDHFLGIHSESWWLAKKNALAIIEILADGFQQWWRTTWAGMLGRWEDKFESLLLKRASGTIEACRNLGSGIPVVRIANILQISQQHDRICSPIRHCAMTCWRRKLWRFPGKVRSSEMFAQCFTCLILFVKRAMFYLELNQVLIGITARL